MVTVFKTNVRNAKQARRLLKEIHLHFKAYRANFDLEDIDNILRVACTEGGPVESAAIKNLLQRFGFLAETL
ncbi:MAG TPA: hypothetical protein VK014_02125 [Cyclobacteriaceae bacterium]|nr:hypothetical protein [Cyclobacteriaceae bacterium]